jgi:hypothetical protein
MGCIFQLGVSIPENTRETPVMIVSELCSNGDLFDYVRNVNPPSMHKVVRRVAVTLFQVFHTSCHVVGHNAGYSSWAGISTSAETLRDPQGLQVIEHSHHSERYCEDCRLRTGQGEAINAINGAQPGWHCQLASTRAVARTSQIQP